MDNELEITPEESNLGVQIVICKYGNKHKIQAISPIILPFDCLEICQKNTENIT